MKVRKNKDSFWVSYSDLMTSLFFIMLVLFIACVIVMSKSEKVDVNKIVAENKRLKKEVAELKKDNNVLKQNNHVLTNKINAYIVSEEQGKRINAIIEMFKSLTEGRTLEYRAAQRTFVAKAFEDREIFKAEKSEFDFNNISRNEILQVGKDLKNILEDLSKSTPECNYQLVIEGTTANTFDKRFKPDYGWAYKLSYERALALYQFWRNNGIDLRKYNTEILICGSGMNGKNRDKAKEDNNKRIVIQIIPKFEKIEKK